MSELTESVGASAEDGGNGGKRRYTRTQVAVSSATFLAVGVAAGWLVPRALERHPRTAVPLVPAAVAAQLGNTCLRVAGSETVSTSARVVKKVGSHVTCEVDWTRGKMTGVIITEDLASSIGRETYEVAEPDNKSPTSWGWSINGNGVGRATPTVILQADTLPNGANAGYETYGCDGSDNCNLGPMSGPIVGAKKIDDGLLEQIRYLGMNAMEHPDQT